MKRILGASVLVLCFGVASVTSAADFSRGDANSDGTLNIADAIFMLNFLYQNGPAPECMDAADLNDDGQVDLADPIHLLIVQNPTGHGFEPGLPPVLCGPDPSVDTLDCVVFPPCP